jgi:hypothetical protein
MTRRSVEPGGPEMRPVIDPISLKEIEAVIATWPEEEAPIGLLVIGSWLAGDTSTLRRAWLRLSPMRVGWLSHVLHEIDPGLPTS